MSSPLVSYFARSYSEVKRLYPTEGRRKWKLRAAQRFWTVVGSGSLSLPPHDVLPQATSVAEFDDDPDPLDGVTRDAIELGLIVRTDFSDEASWVAFQTCLQACEKELISVARDENVLEQPHQPDSAGEQEDDSDDEDDEEGPSAIFHIVNPSSPQERELLTNISNLTILRIFNDLDIRSSPTPPHGTKAIDPPNRLVDYQGWQEFYRGKNVWVYDTQSNIDQCVRVVSQSGDMYGTAAGDSWRARVSHICELQVNLSSGAIKIDFGGLDRWDYTERRRNMIETERG